MNQDGWWWRLVHLEPAVLRGFIAALALLLAAVGVVVLPAVWDAIIAFMLVLLPILQALSTRGAVTANAKVVVEAPDPISDPAKVVPGEAVTKASTSDILDAARDVPRG